MMAGWITICPSFRCFRISLFPERKWSIQIEVSARINSSRPGLRRGIFFNFGMVPSRDANRRALSRSMRALSASRISAVFSATPVNSWAMRTRSSSSATVVLIGTDYSIK